MTTLPPELASLPPPVIVETIAYEDRLQMFVSALSGYFAAAGIAWDVAALEVDPAKILMETAAYADVMLRERINEAVRANLLAYAYDSDLDHLAAFYGVVRMFEETDERLRQRIILAIQGRSTGGTAPRYRYVAMSSDIRVAAVAVYTVGRDPTVNVAVYSNEAGGVASTDLLGVVNAAMQDEAVRMVNDTIVVAAAVEQVVDITANVWLLPGANVSVFSALEAQLRADWAAVATLGFDLTRSWLTAKLMRPGVQKVEIVEPASDAAVAFNKAASIGTVTLTNMGRNF